MRLEQVPPDGFGWMAGHVPNLVFTPHARGLQAVDASGRVRGMVVYDQWGGNSVQAHMAVETPIAWRTLLPHVFLYPFESVGVLIGIIPESNRRSSRMASVLGFRKSHHIRDGWVKGDDLVVWQMRREECRWVPGYHPKRPYFREGSLLL